MKAGPPVCVCGFWWYKRTLNASQGTLAGGWGAGRGVDSVERVVAAGYEDALAPKVK